MKYILTFFISFSFCLAAQAKATAVLPATNIVVEDSTQIVKTACGECKFGLKGNGCHLAVQIKGKAYFVTGTSIDEHGDAHAKDGFCNAIRKAKVSGKIVGDKFAVTSFELLPEKKNK